MTTIGFKSQSNINSNYMPDLIVQTEADISPDQTKEIETELLDEIEAYGEAHGDDFTEFDIFEEVAEIFAAKGIDVRIFRADINITY